ncbi:XRE family transcriptional regulator [Clostridium baratii]|uniref:helix-turn-helix domain-containing protein n=1 Tax=Clostridium baratii TaxID=1561 RepID=UPI0036F28B41
MRLINFGSIAGNKICPDKIKEAREARGLSLAQLSDKIGVSSQAISKYEKGEIVPTPSVLLKMVDVLNFPISFFSTNDTNKLMNQTIYFRSNKNLTNKLKKACKIRIKWINNMYNFINNYFDLPMLDLPDLGEIDIDTLDLMRIEEIANKLRNYWNLGDYPINNLLDILQKKGFVITKLEIGSKKIDAFSIWENDVPYIFIGSEKDSAVRSRFDLAHELAHLILHKDLSEEDFEEEKDILEKQADAFAGAFLLPRESFNKEMITSSIDSFILIKRKWKVSVAAMIRRAQDIDILSDNQIKYLKSQMVKYGYYKKEPFDDILEPEKPYLFKQAFEILVDNKILTKEEILDIVKLNKDEALNLYSLKEDFFEKSNNILKLVK